MIEYQKQIIEIVKRINNINYLKMLLGFAKELQKKQDAEK